MAAMAKKEQGQIIIQSGANVWPHELKTAEALAADGRTVEFIPRSKNRYDKSADVLMDGLIWEMKASKSDKLHMVEQNLRRALKQSRNVIFDSRRMKGLPDHAIERELRKWGKELKSLERLLFVNRHAQVIDIVPGTV